MKRLRNDLTGKTVNFLEILSKTQKPIHSDATYYDCRCKCGKILSIRSCNLRKGKIKSCGCQRAKDWSGVTVNELVVIGPSKRNGYWHCKCKKCNNSCEISANSLRIGTTRTCGCLKYLLNNKNPHWKGFEEISGAFFSKIKDSANSRKILFSIKIEDIWNLFVKQNRKCALSGEIISFTPKTASLDRIDSSKGYVQGNIQWVDKRINIMKQSLSQDEFIALCKKVSLNS